jgi:hypothetical protein
MDAALGAREDLGAEMEPTPRRDRFETWLYGLVAFSLFAIYARWGLASGLTQPGETRWFGVDRWGLHGPGVRAVALVVPPLVALVTYRGTPRLRELLFALHQGTAPAGARCAIALFAATMFWVLRSHFLNPDSLALLEVIPDAVSATGAHVTHDEMWQQYLHSRAWFHANRLFGWDVARTYQVSSALAGGVFVALLIPFAHQFGPSRFLLVACGTCAGGWMQLFFGDVENYTVANVWMFAYFVTAWAFLERRCALAWPSALLAVAMTFHLVAGFLLPSLAVLGLVALERKRRIDVLLSFAGFLTIVVGTVAWFDRHGLPFARFFTHSHAWGGGGAWWYYLAPATLAYHHRVVQLLLLLCPSLLLLPVLVVSRRVGFGAGHLFFALATAGALAFCFAWRAQLGVYQDWNLFAFAAQPVSLWVWTTLAQAPLDATRRAALAGFVATAGLHAAAWIVANHAL